MEPKRRLSEEEASIEAEEIKSLTSSMDRESLEEAAEIVGDEHKDQYDVKKTPLFNAVYFLHYLDLERKRKAAPEIIEKIESTPTSFVIEIIRTSLDELFEKKQDQDQSQIFNNLSNLRAKYPDLFEQVMTRDSYDRATALLVDTYKKDDDLAASYVRDAFGFPTQEVGKAVITATISNLEQGNSADGVDLLLRYMKSPIVMELLKDNGKLVDLLNKSKDTLEDQIAGTKNEDKISRIRAIITNIDECLARIDEANQESV